MDASPPVSAQSQSSSWPARASSSSQPLTSSPKPLADINPPPPRSNKYKNSPLLLGFALTDTQWKQLWTNFHWSRVPTDEELKEDNVAAVSSDVLDALSDKIEYYLENHVGVIDDDAPDSVKQAARECGDIEANILSICKDTDFEARPDQYQFDTIKDHIARAGIDQEPRWWIRVAI